MTNSNRRWAAAVSAVVVAVSAAASGQGQPPVGQPQAPSGNGLIAGQVIDADTGRGIGGVPVGLALLSGANAPAGRAGGAGRPTGVLADSQGRFFFANLGPGTYTPITEIHGYMSAGPLRSVTLDADARVTDVKVLMRRLSTLSGRVLDDAGDPVVGVEVIAVRRLVSQGRPPVLSPVGRARTDDRGDYRIGSLTPDDYLVCACMRDPIPFDGHLLSTLAARPVDLLGVAGRAVSAGADTARLDPTLRAWPVTFHPNATQVSQADRVRVAAGEDRTGVDVTMTAAPARRISGRLLGATSSVTAQMIRLRPVGDVPEAAGLTTMLPMLVQPDGRFDFGNVAPGQYLLEVTFRPGQRGGGPTGQALTFIGGRGAMMQPPPPPPQRGGGPPDPALDPLWASELISVGDRDVTGLTIPLNRSLVVSGRVVFTGNAPQPNAQMLQRPIIQMISLEMGTQVRSYNSGIQTDGSFEMRGVLPGRYVLSPALALPGWPTLRSITSTDGELTDTLLDLSTDLTNVVITITDAPATSVELRVQPVPKDDTDTVWVRVFPADRRLWQEPFAANRRYRALRVTAKGIVTISGLPAGDYHVVTATDGAADWMTPTTLDALSRQGQRFRLAESEKLAVEVRR